MEPELGRAQFAAVRVFGRVNPEREQGGNHELDEIRRDLLAHAKTADA